MQTKTEKRSAGRQESVDMQRERRRSAGLWGYQERKADRKAGGKKLTEAGKGKRGLTDTNEKCCHRVR